MIKCVSFVKRKDTSASTKHTMLYQGRLGSLLIILQGLSTISGGWVDPDTMPQFQSTTALTDGDDRQYKLVFSDEFEVDRRTFDDGHDPRWTAVDKNDYTNDALHYYKSDNVRTSNGVLNITTNHRENTYKAFNEKTKRFYSETKHIQTSMVQGWNKFCLTGGIVEFRAKLPGDPTIGGLWPALWLLGNLARATYVGSSDFMWPWSYNKCDQNTGVSQEINSCRKINHYGLKSFEGRGAPEIDVLEAMGGPSGKLPHTSIQRPYFSASLQLAPGTRRNRPTLGDKPAVGQWYEGFEYGNITRADLNPFFYGVTLVHKPKTYTYQSDALSANMAINKAHFADYHVYRVEWEPSDLDGKGGHIRWYADGYLVYGMDAGVLNFSGAQIPNEPMYMIINTAVSSSWGFPKPCPPGCDCTCYECGNPECDCGLPEFFCTNFPSYFEIDYVRAYQAINESRHELGCSTERRPTELFIEGHRKRYMAEGDTVPLMSLISGGGSCYFDDDCGGSERGVCTGKHCVCHDGSVGPMCRASYAFDEHPYHADASKIAFKVMFMPFFLWGSMTMLCVGFLVFVFVDTRIKKKDKATYNRVSLVYPDKQWPQQQLTQQQSVPNSTISPTGNSQFTMGTNPKERIVRYCMIDGKLIDE